MVDINLCKCFTHVLTHTQQGINQHLSFAKDHKTGDWNVNCACFKSKHNWSIQF